jgi:hypothetical protein
MVQLSGADQQQAAQKVVVIVENCASHSRYFSDELDAQFF